MRHLCEQVQDQHGTAAAQTTEMEFKVEGLYLEYTNSSGDTIQSANLLTRPSTAHGLAQSYEVGVGASSFDLLDWQLPYSLEAGSAALILAGLQCRCRGDANWTQIDNCDPLEVQLVHDESTMHDILHDSVAVYRPLTGSAESQGLSTELPIELFGVSWTQLDSTDQPRPRNGDFLLQLPVTNALADNDQCVTGVQVMSIVANWPAAIADGDNLRWDSERGCVWVLMTEAVYGTSQQQTGDDSDGTAVYAVTLEVQWQQNHPYNMIGRSVQYTVEVGPGQPEQLCIVPDLCGVNNLDNLSCGAISIELKDSNGRPAHLGNDRWKLRTELVPHTSTYSSTKNTATSVVISGTEREPEFTADTLVRSDLRFQRGQKVIGFYVRTCGRGCLRMCMCAHAYAYARVCALVRASFYHTAVLMS